MAKESGTGIKDHPVVSHEAWLSARTAFLAKEKEFTRLRDDLSRQRRELPWVKVDKPYVFDGPGGKETLAQLFWEEESACRLSLHVPRGRDEDPRDPQSWVRYHDRYED